MVKLKLAALAWFGAVLAPCALAQAPTEAQRLAACMEKSTTDGQGAYEDGLAWLGMGNRPMARACVAIALIELGSEEEGAQRLELLANAPDGGSLDDRATYLALAGNGWLLSGAPAAAAVSLTNALKLRPQDASLYRDRARVRMVQKDWQKAGDDLDLSNELSPGDAETLLLRAKVLLSVGRLQEAWSDVEASRRQDATNVDAVVLRGEIRQAFAAKGLPDPAG
jgi:tetratricopeptide (TPR) repeat protein